MKREQDHGGTRLTAGEGVSVSVPAPELPHVALTLRQAEDLLAMVDDVDGNRIDAAQILRLTA